MASPVETLLRDQLNERRRKLEHATDLVPDDEQVRRLLREVDRALARMDKGTFGICETCHDPVEAERLVADPLMEYCLDHLTRPQRQALERDLDLAARVLRGLLPPPARGSPATRWHVITKGRARSRGTTATRSAPRTAASTSPSATSPERGSRRRC